MAVVAGHTYSRPRTISSARRARPRLAWRASFGLPTCFANDGQTNFYRARIDGGRPNTATTDRPKLFSAPACACAPRRHARQPASAGQVPDDVTELRAGGCGWGRACTVLQYTFAWHAWNMRVASDPSRIPNDLLTARLYCSSYAIIVVEKRKIFTGWHYSHCEIP